MWIEYVYDLFKRPISLSLMAHLLCLAFLMLIGRYFNIPSTDMTEVNKKTISLEQLDKDQFEQLKRLGIKNGAKTFSIKQPSQPRLASRISKLTLESLKREIENNSHSKSLKDSNSNQKTAELSLVKRMEKKNISAQKIITEHNIAYSDPQTYRRTSFNIDFIPPEGVNEDELNSMEKMYYSFQKRTYLTYFNSFIKNFTRLSKIRPKLEQAVQTENHVLTGRITYDAQGHIVAIKIIRWSVNDNIQELFDETLKDLVLPNPPVALVKNKEFTIYFQLVFNDSKY
ncbi:MAG: hypothetical protein A2381_18875 [Bdellovibrionales bacterium RIFOXYB1_FULL_37_110]|nr:MAG: hypothetical protein A2181_05185 [Bdellovibrionales bacterium RIFOXYA1_FULL_38_20]OFZ46569.1 MAG: hypothetical protein A2417_13880 [Bdellovibrionales bacterium RIFOXYC1_FULL_37_79]OFZ55927.1 MAG: hypothetical protein A2328_10070 [Bdellovibrionales bacterium RIFOXYB2_FULL_36_6]OFZ57691.1 MAG: hypothetical protein A2381_18875 [Bdellovibrionales bacterium RIFOXYB1_FULL_37_110]OFZ62947.1 MAG: hypothetical protein A2577_11530 [Bdellovibrionales bacterium RIFOXYD1_FULL_36_51]